MFFSQIFLHKTLRKVPEITFLFWLIKILTTALGESTSDYLVHTVNPIIAVIFGATGFFLALFLQFLSRKYTPWIYWLSVTMVAIFGTMAADVVHIVLGIPYFISTLFFAIALAVIFFVWYAREKTLSIHSITSPRRELFYWATVITTFALGTAAGDMTAATFGWGYLGSGIFFGVLFLLPLVGQWKFGLGEVVAFWFAYITTRPLGASFADWFGRSPDLGGVGLGTGLVSGILAFCIVCLVIYATCKEKRKITP